MRKPNSLVILVDDLRHDEFGAADSENAGAFPLPHPRLGPRASYGRGKSRLELPDPNSGMPLVAGRNVVDLRRLRRLLRGGGTSEGITLPAPAPLYVES